MTRARAVGSPRGAQRGQASVEFVAVVLVACCVLSALGAVAPVVDGRSIGGFFARHIVCAVSGRCQDEEAALVDAYGPRDAALVRELAPNLAYEGGERQLPVDWRECRRPECAEAPDDASLDAHLAEAPLARGRGVARRARATAFTRVIRRDGRLYVGYWLYYPDSNTAFAGSDRIWERSWLLPRIRELVSGTPDYPGYHRDDWEGAFVRLDPDGSTWVRASSHGGFQGCKWVFCDDDWARSTGWVRVSKGSHSGHVPMRIEPPPRHPRELTAPRQFPLPGSGGRRMRRVPLVPGRNLEERSTTGEGLRLIPLETLDKRRYTPLDPDINPPWRKKAYTDPESDES
jgi:hypothetical protein